MRPKPALHLVGDAQAAGPARTLSKTRGQISGRRLQNAVVRKVESTIEGRRCHPPSRSEAIAASAPAA